MLTTKSLASRETPLRVRRRGREPVFQVQAIRESRRLKEDGTILNQAFITLLQTGIVEHDGASHKIRGGSTLVLDLDENRVSYVIRKGIRNASRIERIIGFQESRDGAPLAATYFGPGNEPFAALHHVGA